MSKKKLLVTVAVLILVIAVLAAIIVFKFQHSDGSTARLTIETPGKVSLSDETVTLDVKLSKLGNALYPAASISLSFDPSRLEFLGIEEGNLLIHDESIGKRLPDWSNNVTQSNQTGVINIMYLDLTGGKNAFSKELFEEHYNTVLRLKFRLRGSLRDGDVCDIIIEDAVFAASDETQSLASSKGTLKTKNGKIVITK